jgi:hypothetical protein
MKHILRIFIFLLILSQGCLAFAQSSVFVMVDVSGNPLHDNHTMEMRNSARDLVEAIITNNYDSQKFSDWKFYGIFTDSIVKDIINGKGKPLLTKDGHLAIMPFGNRRRYLDFKINQIKHYPSDFYQDFRTNYPDSYKDQQTFMHIAEAHLAYIATERNIDKYYLIKVLGKGEDTDYSYSHSHEEKERHDNYRSAFNIKGLGLLRYKSNNIDFRVTISEIDVTRILAAKNRYNLPKLIKPKVNPPN